MYKKLAATAVLLLSGYAGAQDNGEPQKGIGTLDSVDRSGVYIDHKRFEFDSGTLVKPNAGGTTQSNISVFIGSRVRYATESEDSNRLIYLYEVLE